MGLTVGQLREAERAGRTICCECGNDCDPKTPFQVHGMYYCKDHKKDFERHVGYNHSNYVSSSGNNKEEEPDRRRRKALPVQPTMAFCPSCGAKKLRKDILLGRKGYECKNEPCKLFFDIEAVEAPAEPK